MQSWAACSTMHGCACIHLANKMEDMHAGRRRHVEPRGKLVDNPNYAIAYTHDDGSAEIITNTLN